MADTEARHGHDPEVAAALRTLSDHGWRIHDELVVGDLVGGIVYHRFAMPDAFWRRQGVEPPPPPRRFRAIRVYEDWAERGPAAITEELRAQDGVDRSGGPPRGA